MFFFFFSLHRGQTYFQWWVVSWQDKITQVKIFSIPYYDLLFAVCTITLLLFSFIKWLWPITCLDLFCRILLFVNTLFLVPSFILSDIYSWLVYVWLKRTESLHSPVTSAFPPSAYEYTALCTVPWWMSQTSMSTFERTHATCK